MKRLYPIFVFFLFAFWLQAAELQTYEGCRLQDAGWSDGDSFPVQFPDGSVHTIRLYGVDCIEWHVADDSDARRLRAQRRYFGIAGYGGNPQESITLSKGLGEAAARRVAEWLQQPFTLHTANADARGDGRYKRVYGFITTSEGEDLSRALVKAGLARAFGVCRMTPDGLTASEYRELLRDLEFVAARKGTGIWRYTDWESLTDQRIAQRAEEYEQELAMGSAEPRKSLDVNTASRDQLMGIPGVGEKTANRMIEGRPYSTLDDLLRVHGIGPVGLGKITPWLHVKQNEGNE